MIRPMNGQDIEAVAAIEAATYDFPWTEGIFQDCLQVGYDCWVIEEAGILVAYGVMQVVSEEMHLFNMCVRQDRQRRGIGAALLQYLLTLAQQKGAMQVWLEVRASNVAALTLYEQFGFVRVGLRKEYYPVRSGREDAVLMEKKIAD